MNDTICIVGSGFAGLFSALQLKLKTPSKKIIILEKNNVAGGKVTSIRVDEKTVLEMGPSVFHSNQKYMLWLIDRYKVKVVKLEKDIVENLVSIKNCKTNKNKYVKDVIDTTRMRTGNEIAYMDYAAWVANFVLQDEADVFRVQNGYQEIIDHMTKELKLLGVQFHFNIEVTSIQVFKNHTIIINVFEKPLPFLADKLIVSTSKEDLPRFVNLTFAKPFENIVANSFSESTLRVVVKLDKPLPKNFSRDHFNHFSTFRWCLRGPRNDLLILSYVDGDEARKRFTEAASLQHIFVRTCLNELNLRDFAVVKIFWGEWPEAFTIIGPGNNYEYDNMHKICQNIYTTCLPAEFNQAWIEGALISSVKCVDSILTEYN